MKKMFVALLLIVVLLSLVQIGAFAADSGRRACFTDADNDGVCDMASENCGNGFVDENADGVCDNNFAGCEAKYANAEGECGMAPRCGRGYGMKNCCRR